MNPTSVMNQVMKQVIVSLDKRKCLFMSKTVFFISKKDEDAFILFKIKTCFIQILKNQQFIIVLLIGIL